MAKEDNADEEIVPVITVPFMLREREEGSKALSAGHSGRRVA